MSLAEDLIRERIAADATDSEAAELAIGLTHDKFKAAGGTDLAAIEAAIAAARKDFAPLFKASQPAKPEPVKPKHDTATAAGRRAADLDAKVDKAWMDGNPYKKMYFNRTQQAILEKNRPELAKQMKEAAGGR